VCNKYSQQDGNCTDGLRRLCQSKNRHVCSAECGRQPLVIASQQLPDQAFPWHGLMSPGSAAHHRSLVSAGGVRAVDPAADSISATRRWSGSVVADGSV